MTQQRDMKRFVSFGCASPNIIFVIIRILISFNRSTSRRKNITHQTDNVQNVVVVVDVGSSSTPLDVRDNDINTHTHTQSQKKCAFTSFDVVTVSFTVSYRCALDLSRIRMYDFIIASLYQIALCPFGC